MTVHSSIVSSRVLRVLIADDSAVVQDFLREILEDEPDMLVVGTARNGEEVLLQAKALLPDLITMDVNMPRLDGVAATRRIMAECPAPIAVVTAAPVDSDSELAFKAMAAGAVEVLSKPRRLDFENNPGLRDGFVRQLRNVAYVKVVGIRGQRGGVTPGRGGQPEGVAGVAGSLAGRASAPAGLGSPLVDLSPRSPRVIAVGASTGGPPALRTVLSRLDPERCPPVLLVQHMSAEFLPGFATWLEGVVEPKVAVARSGELLLPGTIYVAAGDQHLIAIGSRVGLVKRPPVHFQRPSVDVLFESVAQAFGSAAVGILLTGMGRDGAQGLLAMKQRGALTISQDEASSLAYGMPRAAAELDAARMVAPPEQIALLLRHMVSGVERPRKSQS